MDRLPGSLLSIHLDDAISREFSKQIQEDSNAEEEDEDDEYLYDEPPPYDIGAKLVEINAELASFQLPQDGRARRVTFLENPVQSEIPPTPTDSTDEDDGYGDSTEASDDADGFCALAGAHQSDDVGHIVLQHPLVPIHPADEHNHDEERHGDLDTGIMEDEVSRLMMLAKQRNNVIVGTEKSITLSNTSLSEELNLFLRSFTEMAIKNGAETILEGVINGSTQGTTRDGSLREFEVDDIVRQNLTSEISHESGGSITVTRPEAQMQDEQEEDDVIEQAEVDSRANSPNQNGTDIHRDLILESSNISNLANAKDDDSKFDEFDSKSDFSFPSGMLTLTNSVPNSPKSDRNSMSNFLKWKRAFRMIHRKTKVSSQWDMTVDEILEQHRAQFPTNAKVDQSDDAITNRNETLISTVPSDLVHASQDRTDNAAITPTPTEDRRENGAIISMSTESQNKKATIYFGEELPKQKNSSSAVPNSNIMVSSTKMISSIPLPAIGCSPRVPTLSNGSDQEPMIMTSQDGQFCLMTTEDFQSFSGVSVGKIADTNNSVGMVGRGLRLAKTSAAVQRPLKVRRGAPEVTKGHHPMLRKSNSTLNPEAGFGKLAVGKPYSKGTFPVKSASGFRSRSASASGGRRRIGSEFETERDAQLTQEGAKNIFPPHGYGLSEEQKQERERKLKRMETDRSMKRQRELEEKQRRKQEGEEAFQAWLRTKTKNIYPSSNAEGDQMHDSHKKFLPYNKDSGIAFQEWLKRKKEQKQEERRVEEFKQMVEEQMHYTRTREQNELAFRKWLRRKRNRNGRIVGNS